MNLGGAEVGLEVTRMRTDLLPLYALLLLALAGPVFAAGGVLAINRTCAVNRRTARRLVDAPSASPSTFSINRAYPSATAASWKWGCGVILEAEPEVSSLRVSSNQLDGIFAGAGSTVSSSTT